MHIKQPCKLYSNTLSITGLMLRQVRAAHSSQNFTTVPHQTTNSKATRTLNVSKALLKSGTLQNVQIYLIQLHLLLKSQQVH